jgi:Fe2+ transport system protein B
MNAATVEETVKTAVDIALLQQGQKHMEEKMTVFHTETKASLNEMNEKFDAVLKEMIESRQRSKMRSAMWASARHLGTVIVTLVLAHKFKIPLDIGG